MPAPDTSAELLETAGRLIDAARKAGATAADAVVAERRSKSVSVRNGTVESTESADSGSFSLRVFDGVRVARISAHKNADPDDLAARAVAMARVSPEDPFACLADAANLARSWPELDLYDDNDPQMSELENEAIATEAAALAVKGVSSSIGASASAGFSGLVLVTSHGFSGAFRRSGFSRSVSVIAGEGTGMERDYDYDSRVHRGDLDAPDQIGRRAGERVVRRLAPRKAETRKGVTVVYDPRVARGFIGHMISAINGASVARKTSFFKDSMGKQITIPGLTITDDPFIVRGPASRPFDGEGVSSGTMTMVEDGVLKNWYLSTPIARELGLETNGRALSGGSASSTNVRLTPGEMPPEELIRSVGTGFYVTEMIGHGVNPVTGEYSRGATGFWIENGELTYPVSEVTIASNVKDMFKRMTLANDIDPHYSIAAPTIAVEGMTLAGA